jgi:hypothetical protein
MYAAPTKPSMLAVDITRPPWIMSPASSDASMLAVAVPAPLRPTLLAVDSCTRQHANLLVPGQIVSGLVYFKSHIFYF